MYLNLTCLTCEEQGKTKEVARETVGFTQVPDDEIDPRKPKTIPVVRRFLQCDGCGATNWTVADVEPVE